MRHDAIVVGGGAAGLTAAAYLCRSGHQVLLCEQNEKTGGLVTSFSDRGFTFDAGIRAFENCGILLPMLRQLGIDLELQSSPVAISIGRERIHLRSRESLADYEQLLARFFPDEQPAIRRIMQEIETIIGYMDVIYGIDNPLFMEIAADKDYLMKTLLPWLWQYQKKMRKVARLQQPVNVFLRRFTNHQALIDMITQHFFTDTPTFFALSYFGLYLDYSYPRGGTGVLAEKLTADILARGGTILTQTAIRSVDPAAHQIQAADGRSFTYRQLLWAADSRRLYQAVAASGRTLPRKLVRHKQQIDDQAAGESVLTIFLATGIEPAQVRDRCGPHAFHTPVTDGLVASGLRCFPQASGKEDRIRQIKAYLAATTYEIACPVLRDPT
ncbi:MAG: FAD-dependent oxidoreductase, partial [Clostridia bacterium]|nr:FAD-dependent oxidoreductase [Clostridia bacterium]